MAQIDDLIKKLLEEKTASTNSYMAKYADKTGLNKLLTNPVFQKIRTGIVAGKAGLHTLGAGNSDSMFGAGSYGSALVDTSGAALGLSTPFKGREIAKQIEMANVRKRLQSQAGYNNTGKDAMASTAASMANMKSVMNSTAMLAMVAGAGNSGLITPGIMASKMFGGLEGLGSAAAGGIASGAGALGAGKGVTSAIAGINPMMMGMMAAIVATKATSMAYKAAIDGGSSNKLGKKALITSGTSTHQLEQDFGNTSALRMQIARMQNTGMLKPGEALIANILAMIEGHTSVLPYIAANAIDSESRRNKESAGNSQNHLEDLFGMDGAVGSNDQLKKGKMNLISKIFTGMEKTTANLSATFDIMGQLSNTLAGKSSTALYNEANSKDKTPEMLKAEKKFGETFGIPTGMVQAIHTTPAQIMNSSDTYEGKVLSLLGLNSEINRFSAHELLKIRTTGFGIKNETTNGYLAKLNEDYEEERLHKEDASYWGNFQKKMDEVAGYIPGYQVLSGTYKMLNSVSDSINQFASDKANGKVRSFKQVWTDFLGDGRTNDVLNSEDELRRKVGATERGASEQMASYLGEAYPDRFELLLSYNLSQMESLKAMAGNVDYSSNEKLSMNKYTGKFQNDKAHQDYENEVAQKIYKEMDLIQDPIGFFQNQFGDDQKTKDRQVELGRENNPFLDSFLKNDASKKEAEQQESDKTEKDNYNYKLFKMMQEGNGSTNAYSQNNPLGEIKEGVGSADDMTDRQHTEEQEERKMSLGEQQVALLQEIRDCCTGQEGRDYDAENARRTYEEKIAKGKDDPAGGLIGSLLSGIGTGPFASVAAKAAPILPRLGIWGLGIAGALAAGFLIWDSLKPSEEAVDTSAEDRMTENEKEIARSKIKAAGTYISNNDAAGFNNDALKVALADAQKNNITDIESATIRTTLASRNMFHYIPVSKIFKVTQFESMHKLANAFSSSPLKLQHYGLNYLLNINAFGIQKIMEEPQLSKKMLPLFKELLTVQKSLEETKDITISEHDELLKNKRNIIKRIGVVNDENDSASWIPGSSQDIRVNRVDSEGLLTPTMVREGAESDYNAISKTTEKNSGFNTKSITDYNSASGGGPGAIAKDLGKGLRIKMEQVNGLTQEKSEGSISWRANNPGNIKAEWAKHKKGYAGSYTNNNGTFAIFDTLENGNAARRDLLFVEGESSQKYYEKNIDQMTETYAPAEHMGNDPVAYAKAVKTKLGKAWAQNKKLGEYSSDEQDIIMNAMQQHEGWKVGKTITSGQVRTPSLDINSARQYSKDLKGIDDDNDGKISEKEAKAYKDKLIEDLVAARKNTNTDQMVETSALLNSLNRIQQTILATASKSTPTTTELKIIGPENNMALIKTDNIKQIN